MFVTDINLDIIWIGGAVTLEFQDSGIAIPQGSWDVYYDSVGEMIYWTDLQQDRVWRSFLNGTQQEDLTSLSFEGKCTWS